MENITPPEDIRDQVWSIVMLCSNGSPDRLSRALEIVNDGREL